VERSCSDVLATEVDCDTGIEGDATEVCYDFGDDPDDPPAIEQDCSDDVAARVGETVYEWCFEFADGVTECGLSDSNTDTINDMTVHLSCSANYDAFGYPDKDQPDASLGDPAVVEYSVTKWKVDDDGVCDEDKTCGDEFDVVPDDCPNTSACVQLAEAWDRGDAILSTSDSMRLEITNLGVNDICIDDWSVASSIDGQDIAVSVLGNDGLPGGVIAAGETVTLAMGSYTQDNGVYYPALGEEPMWCLEASASFLADVEYDYAGASLPAELLAYLTAVTDVDGDGVDDQVDWAGSGAVQTQQNLWDVLTDNPVLTVGRGAHYIDVVEGEQHLSSLIVRNIGKLAGTGLVEETVPDHVFLSDFSHTPDSVTVQDDGSTTYAWSVSLAGRVWGSSAVNDNGYLYDSEEISYSVNVGQIGCNGREDGWAPSVTYTDAGGDTRTSSGSQLILECCTLTDTLQLVGSGEEAKWWKERFKRARDGSFIGGGIMAMQLQALMTDADAFLLTSDHGADAPFTLDDYDDAFQILDGKAGSGEAAKLRQQLLGAELNYLMGDGLTDGDAALGLLIEAEEMAWKADRYSDDEIKEMRELLEDINKL
jgi:hypothetical protein